MAGFAKGLCRPRQGPLFYLKPSTSVFRARHFPVEAYTAFYPQKTPVVGWFFCFIASIADS